MDSTRIIPDVVIPPEQTQASLRKLLREAHGREYRLEETLIAMQGAFSRLKDMIQNPGTMEHAEIAYVINKAIDMAEGIIGTRDRGTE